MTRGPGGGRRGPTLTETARRAQLIDVTIGEVAAKGYARTSLGGIATAAGITKAAILYYFPSKDALVDAAYEHVLAELVAEVTSAIGAVGAAEGPGAYVRSMIGHLRDHPRHTRMIIGALSRGGHSQGPQERWGPLARLIDAAADARGCAPVDSRTLAIILGGAIDAIVSERLHDPAYDVTRAADQLVDLLDAWFAR